MDDREKLSYYKSLVARNITLTSTQVIDMQRIMRERGPASSEAMPTGTAKHEEAKRKL